MDPESNPNAVAEAVPVRTVPQGRPALLYILGAFGLIIGAVTSAVSVNTAVGLSISRDRYVAAVKGQADSRSLGQALSPLPAADIERYVQKQAEAQYDRRLATIPLAVAGIVISCLLFSGAIRSMMGDGTALATWSLAATAAIPHRLLTFVATVLTVHDVQNGLGNLEKAPLLAGLLLVEQALSAGWALVLTLYFAACLVYLRRPSLLGRFSGGEAGSRPSA